MGLHAPHISFQKPAVRFAHLAENVKNNRGPVTPSSFLASNQETHCLKGDVMLSPRVEGVKTHERPWRRIPSFHIPTKIQVRVKIPNEYTRPERYRNSALLSSKSKILQPNLLEKNRQKECNKNRRAEDSNNSATSTNRKETRKQKQKTWR